MQSRPSGVELLEALESGEVRAAEPGPEGWVVNAWVKEGILDIFRTSEVVPHGLELSGDLGESGGLAFRDKEPFLVRRFTDKDDVRLVPGGSAIRRGTYIGPGVVCMPPMYLNVGTGAVLAAGVVLTGGSVVHDLVHGRELSGNSGEPLEIPENAVVIPGTRALKGGYAASKGLSAACALIVKYRDASTDAATALEDAVR